MRKGLCIEELSIFRRSRRPLLGTIPHCFLDDVRWFADWFSGHLVFEAPGKPKVTDLEMVEPTVTLTDEAVVVTGRIASSLGAIDKTITISWLDGFVQGVDCTMAMLHVHRSLGREHNLGHLARTKSKSTHDANGWDPRTALRVSLGFSASSTN
jgi:hypothetical protein